MTLGTTPPLIEYVENGVTLVHAIPFQFEQPGDIVCARVDADFIETPLVQGTDYSVTGGAGGTGTVTKTSSGAAGTVFRIRRLTGRDQAAPFDAHDDFPAENMGLALDRLAAVNQEQDQDHDLLEASALRGPLGDDIEQLPAPPSRLSKFMQWASDGKSLLMLSASDLAVAISGQLAALLPAFKGDPGGNVMAIGLFTAAAGLSIPIGTELVQTSGYSASGTGHAHYTYDATVDAAYVAAHPRTSFVSANGRGFKLAETFPNFHQFGVLPDANANGTTGTDNTAAFQGAVDHINSLGGGSLHLPAGFHRITSYVTLCKNLLITGTGRRGSWIVCSHAGGGGATTGESVRNGTALYSNWPSNAATNAEIRVENIGIRNGNNANVGAAFYDNCGIYISMSNCQIQGFKYGVIMDQSELFDVDLCEFVQQVAGGAGVYMVNGPTLTPGNLGTFTNRNSVTRCQLNEFNTSYGILDEGGYTHSYIDNNYNGCLNHIYLAGAQDFRISGGEFEGAGGINIVLDFRRVGDLSAVGGCYGTINAGFISNGANANINIASSSGPISIFNNQLSRSLGGNNITGAANASELVLFANLYSDATTEGVDSTAYFLSDNRRDLNIRTWTLNAMNLTKFYANCVIRCTSATAVPLTIQPDSAGVNNVVPIGSIFMAEQSAAGQVSFVAGAGVTITGPLTTTKQNQSLVARKMAANSWKTFRMATPPATGWAAPTGTADRTTFDTATVTLPLLAQRVKALIDDLTAQGKIGA